MLKITAQQIAKLDQATREDFARRAITHLREFFPEKIERAGEQETREFVDRVLTRAREYDIVSEQDVCLFLDLVVTFGWNFDRNHAWARRILTDLGYGAAETRVELLFEAALRECGPTYVAALNAPSGGPRA